MLRIDLSRTALRCALSSLLAVSLAACPSDDKRPLGSNCGSNGECASGLCAGGVCLDPDEDADLDGLTNGIEVQLGSNPLADDTDGDGILDGDEVVNVTNVDTDGDSLADIIESATADADSDCITDQYDANNDVADSDLSPMVPVVCSDLGVCQGQRAVMQVECSTGTARCVYDAVPGYVDPEAKCDGIDQNCDGVADDGFPDRDGDGEADCVDVDWDNDLTADDLDNCPSTANADQADGDDDGVGNACVNAYRLTFIEGPGDEIRAGVPFRITVGLTAIDDEGAPLPAFKGTVQIALEAGAGVDLSGTLSQVAGTDGVTVFDDLVVEGPAAGVTLVATSGDLGSGLSVEFDVAAAEATELVFEQLPSSTVAGAPFAFEIVARDSFGNVFDEYEGPLTFSSSDPEATLPDDTTFTVADGGRKLFNGAVLRTAGAQKILAASADIGGEGTVGVEAADFDALIILLPDEVVAGEDVDLVVIAGDEFGNPVPEYDATLALGTSDPLAELPETLSPSDSTPGRYEATLRGGEAGTHTITISAESGDSAELSYEVVAGPVNRLEVTAPESIGAAVPFAVTVTARDVMGNAAVGFDDTVTLVSSDVGALLPDPYPYTAADAGTHTFEGVTLYAALGQTITAMAGELSETVEINVLAGDVAALVITEAPATLDAGAAFSLSAELRDASGNVVEDLTRTIRITANETELRLVGAETSAFTVSDLVITEAGPITVEVSAVELGLSDSVVIDVSPGAATHLWITGPGGAAAGEAFDVTVSARDEFDNIAVGYRGQVQFSTDDPSTDPAPIVPADYTFTDADQGTHTFTGGVTLQTAGAIEVTVTDQTPLAQPSAVLSVSVGGGSATRIALTGPSSTVAGTPFEITVTAYDANGNIANGYTGTVAFSAPAVEGFTPPVLPADYTFTAGDAGRHTFSGVTLYAAGSTVITATDQTPLSDPTATLEVDVEIGAVSQFLLSRDGTDNVPAGTGFDVTVTAADLAGNPVPDYTNQVAFSVDERPEDPAAVLPGPYTFAAGDGGVKAFSGITLYAAGDRTVTVTEQGADVPVQGELMVSVDAGEPSSLAFDQQPADGVAGAAQASAVTVNIADAYGNPVAVDDVEVSLSLEANPGRAYLTGDTTASSENGTATFSGVTLDRAGLGYTLTATATDYFSAVSDPFDMTWPAPVIGAPALAADGACVEVTYQASHSLALPLDVRVEYNLNDDTPDAGWLPATAAGFVPTQDGDPVGVNGVIVDETPAAQAFLWNALDDLGGFDTQSVSVRVTAAAGDASTTSAATTYSYDASWQGRWVPSPHSGAPIDSALVDADHDGFLDLITIRGDSQAVYFHRGDGSGEFEADYEVSMSIDGLEPLAMAVAPLRTRYDNDNGHFDIVVADGAEDRVFIQQTKIHSDSGRLTAANDFTISDPCGTGVPSDVAVGRLVDSTSRVQVWIACPDANKVVSYSWSGQTWDEYDSLDTDSYGSPVVLEAADLDANGEDDLVIGLESGGVLLFGAPDYFQVVDASGLGEVTDIAVADLDRDGFKDVVIVDDVTSSQRFFAVFGKVVRNTGGPTQLVDTSSMRSIGTRLAPSSIEVADFDRDGWTDVALGLIDDDAVSVVRSQSWRSGSVVEEIVSTGSTTDGPNSLEVGDINNDGWPDLALTRAVLTGIERVGAVVTEPRPDCDPVRAGGGEAPILDLHPGRGVVVDVDGDARLDVVYPLGSDGSDGGVAVVYGLGNGRFASDYDILFESALSTGGIAVGDLDGDGNNDIAVHDGFFIRVFRQLGRHSWSERTDFGGLPAVANGLMIADVDNDRRDDLLWLGSGDSTTLYVYRQLPNGLLSQEPAGGIPAGTTASDLKVADINGDGVLDPVILTHRAELATTNICTLMSTSAATWDSELTDANCHLVQHNGHDLDVAELSAVIDVDEDGALEAALLIERVDDLNTFQIYHQSAPGLFSEVEDDNSNLTNPPGYQFCRGIGSPTFVDLGRPSLDVAVFCSEAPTIRSFERKASGYQVSPPRASLSDLEYTSLLAGDFNGDFANDLLADTTLFQRASMIGSSLYGDPLAFSSQVAMADFNGDGFFDIASVGSESEVISIARQVAGEGGSFRVPAYIGYSPSFLSALAAGDFDGDGRNDLAVAYDVDEVSGLAVLTQDGFEGISFTREDFSFDFYSYPDGHVPLVADFDDNGLDDIALVVDDNFNFAGDYVAFFLQQTPGDFERTSTQVYGSISTAAVGRIRQPTSIPDSTLRWGVAATGQCNEAESACIMLMDLYDCDGVCDVRTLFTDSKDEIGSIAVGDLDRNGQDDIVVVQESETDRYATFFLQDASGKFDQVSLSVAQSPHFSGRVGQIRLADVDRDGWLDVVAEVWALRNDVEYRSFEIVFNESDVGDFAMSTETQLEALGYHFDEWLLGDFLRTGRPVMGTFTQDGDLVRFKD